MTHSIQETREGTYREPFTQTQYGVFVTKADGSRNFIAACVGGADSARMKAENYYRKMNSYEHNDVDMTDLDRLEIAERSVTYGLWEFK